MELVAAMGTVSAASLPSPACPTQERSVTARQTSLAALTLWTHSGLVGHTGARARGHTMCVLCACVNVCVLCVHVCAR